MDGYHTMISGGMPERLGGSRRHAGRRSRMSSSPTPSQEVAALTEPLSRLDVDKELWEVLDLCSDEELEAVYNILHGPSPFSPVVKSLVKESEPPLVELRGRTSLMHKVRSMQGQKGGCWPELHAYTVGGTLWVGSAWSHQSHLPRFQHKVDDERLHACWAGVTVGLRVGCGA